MEIDTDKWISTTCDIANQILRLKFGKDYEKECIIFDDDTSSYTEKAQNIFNNILYDVEGLLLEQGLEQEEI